jgi:DNA-directed RNA polymerase subunit RPC12/RpoP
MSLHINYDYECPECGAEYIPYDNEVPCPKCGFLEKKRYAAFVEDVVQAMGYNALTGFGCMPAAYTITCIADSVSIFLFKLFECYSQYRDEQSFESFVQEFIRNSYFEDAEYMREYMGVLAHRVYQEITRQKAKEEPEAP